MMSMLGTAYLKRITHEILPSYINIFSGVVDTMNEWVLNTGRYDRGSVRHPGYHTPATLATQKDLAADKALMLLEENVKKLVDATIETYISRDIALLSRVETSQRGMPVTYWNVLHGKCVDENCPASGRCTTTDCPRSFKKYGSIYPTFQENEVYSEYAFDHGINDVRQCGVRR